MSHALSSPDTAASCADVGLEPSVQQVVEGLKNLIRSEISSAHDIAFERLTRSAGGLSRENWSLDASWTDDHGTHAYALMLMRDAAGTLLNTERTREFDVLKALQGTAVVAPVVHWIDTEGQFLGAPSVVMQRMPGSCDYMVLNGSRPLEERFTLAKAFLELLVNIHAVDWRAKGLGERLGVPKDSPSVTELRHWETEYLRARLEPHPEMDYVLAWLKRGAPQPEAIVLVHGDFKPGNALVEGMTITAKLDWETAHLGDPLEDLGWITNPVRKSEHQIAGHWERQQIVHAYRQLTGREAREADLTWWNVFSCWKLAVIQLTAVNEFVAGRYNRVFQTPTWLFRPMFQMMSSK
jgi:aminoglycoside phosphotransferase (APT) family kinase protein